MSERRKMLAEMLEKGSAKDLRTAASKLDDHGRDGDTLIAHINPREAALLKALGGRGTINPKTGLLEFADSEGQGTSEAGATGAGTSDYGSVGGGYDTGGSPGYDPGYGTIDTFSGYTSDPFSGQLSDLSQRDQNDIARGGLMAGGAEVGLSDLGGLGRFAGRQIDKAIASPIATAINFGTGGIFGAANTLSGLMNGPTLGGTITAAGRSFGDALGLNGPQAPSTQAASASGVSAGGGNGKGDGGPLSGDTTGSGGGLASGSGNSPLGGNSVQSPLAQALLGNAPNMGGRMTYGAPVPSFSPYGREYTTPWAYRG